MVEHMDLYNYKDNFYTYKGINTQCLIKSKKDHPFFTVMMPTYKRADTIKIALGSVLSQKNFDDYEVVIINNLPIEGNDETKIAIEQFDSNKISYYVNDKNIGLCGNWNRCIEKANGKYIVMLHDDDMMGPYCLESLYRVINEFNSPAMVGCSNITFTSKNMPSFAKPKTIKLRKITKNSFFFGRYIGIAGMTFKKDLALSVGGFNDEYYPNEDTIFIYQMLMKGKILNIENKLVGYRTEVNLTTSDGVLEKMILMTEYMRRNISQHEKIAERWMKKYDKPFLYEYINGANQCWNGNIEPKIIFNEFAMGEECPSRMSMFNLRVAERIEKLIHSRNEKMRSIYL